MIETMNVISGQFGYDTMHCNNDDIKPVNSLESDSQKIVMFDDFTCDKNQKPVIGLIKRSEMFIDQITSESRRAARIESNGAYYIQATHLQQISDLSILNDKSKLSISNKAKRYKLSINNIKLI